MANRTNNDLQNSTQKTKDRATRTPLKIGCELMCSKRVTPVYSSYKVGDKSWMRKALESVYDRDIPQQITKVMVATKKSDYMTLTKRNPWFSIFLNNNLSRKSWYEAQALEYQINWEIYTPYTGTAGMLLHINDKFIKGILNHLFCHKVWLIADSHCKF